MAEDKFSKALKAWHASPYDFEKFGPVKEVSGSGQGAASYGRGLYVAESPKVSGPGRSQYMEEFERHPAVKGNSGWHIKDDHSTGGFARIDDSFEASPEDLDRTIEWFSNRGTPEQIPLYAGRDWVADDLSRHHDNVFRLQELVEAAVGDQAMPDSDFAGLVMSDYDSDIVYSPRHAEIVKKFLSEPKNWSQFSYMEDRESSGPYSYEVAVHLKPETMLDWDETMDNHHPEAYNKIARMYDEKVDLPRKAQGQDYFGPSSGATLYRELTRRLGSDFATSEALHEAGIHGLRYLDGVSRRKWDDYTDKVAAAKPYDRIKVDKLKVVDGKTLKRPEVLKELNETIYPDNDTGFIQRPSSVEDLIRHITDYRLGSRTLDPKTAGKYIDWLNWIAENQHNLTVNTTKTRVTPKMPEKPTDLTYNYVIFHPDFVEAVSQYNIKGEKTKDFGPGVHLKSVEHDPFEGEK